MPQHQKKLPFMEIQDIVATYSPWMEGEDSDEWQRVLHDVLPAYHRPVFLQVVNDIETAPQIISIAGPRRVGKSTLLKQVAKNLLDKQVPTHRIIYYAFDDPALYRPGLDGDQVFSSLMEHVMAHKDDGQAYLLLDEIQKLEGWELYLKKYYDMHYPVRFVISGSASSPIFKKSRESLMGRINEYHVLPFSFSEYLCCVTQGDEQTENEVKRIQEAGCAIRGMFSKHPDHFDTQTVQTPMLTERLWNLATSQLEQYFVDGGFPEVWNLKTQEQKIDYLFTNQVNKVITEDLVLAVELRKPEQLKQFYISLLEKPGCEVNMSSLSRELGISSQQIDKYLPLLQMTDLIRSVSKFRKSSIRVRTGSQKFYPVDLALRNAVLRLGREILDDDTVLGLYAETLVFNALMKWQGILKIDYYRESQMEVDFIVHHQVMKYLPIEVKYSQKITQSDVKGVHRFRSKYHCSMPLLITKERHQFGRDDDLGVFQIPLPLFLLLFD